MRSRLASPQHIRHKIPDLISQYAGLFSSAVDRIMDALAAGRDAAVQMSALLPQTTRYDKLAANHLAFIKLASIRIWLRANESTPYSCPDYVKRCRR
jgi:hypothetical protein